MEEENPGAAPAEGAAVPAGDPQAADTKKGAAPRPGKKRKVAVFLGYLGAGFHGMQRNPPFPTIEEALEKAMVAAGAISSDNAGSFAKIHWMRAARTDKGVSATCQVVSAKLNMEQPPDMVDRINSHLPAQIRVYGYVRTTEGFDARRYCDRRRYEYILPAWAFDPSVCAPKPEAERAATSADARAAAAAAASAAVAADATAPGGAGADGGEAAERQAAATDAEGGGGAAEGGGALAEGVSAEALLESVYESLPERLTEAAAAGGGGEGEGGGEGAGGEGAGAVATSRAHGRNLAASRREVTAEQQDKLKRLRAEVASSTFEFKEEHRARLDALLRQYEGTHNFHNFTVGMDAFRPEAMRYMLSFRCPGMLSIGGEPWVQMVVVGQSFMLHQIRKMVGMAVAVFRGTAHPESIRLALGPERDLNAPMAPELGLFLDETFYDAYNARWEQVHGPISFEPFRAQAEAFKAAHVYPHMSRTDARDMVNALWLCNLTEGAYRFSEWATRPPARSARDHQERKRRARLAAEPHAKTDLRGEGAGTVVGSQESYGLAKPSHTPKRHAQGAAWAAHSGKPAANGSAAQGQHQRQQATAEEAQDPASKEEAARMLEALYGAG